MRTIKIDEEIYRYLCSQTQEFGEEPTSILRRLLRLDTHGGTQHTIRPAVPSADPNDPDDPDDPDDTGEDSPDTPPPFGASLFQAPPPADPAPNEPPEPAGPTSDLAQFLSTGAFIRQRKALGRLFAVLAWLYERHGEDFEEVAKIRGRHRAYFARDPEDIKRTGSSTLPQPIPKTPWYVATNTSTRLKQVILRKILSRLGYSKADIEQAAALLDPRRGRAWSY